MPPSLTIASSSDQQSHALSVAKSESTRETASAGSAGVQIGLSRIYLGVHFASDVLAGFAIALSYLIIFTSVVFKNKNKKSQE